MALFKKNPPAACPKCGKADGWRVLTAEASLDYVNQGSAVNSFSLTGAMGKKSSKLRYHCDSCGYEKAY